MFDAAKRSLARMSNPTSLDNVKQAHANEADEKAVLPAVGAVAGGGKDGVLSNAWTEDKELLGSADIDPVYYAKMHLVNQAFAEIGMGRYQVCLLLIVIIHVDSDNPSVVVIRCCGLWVVCVSTN